MQLNMLKNDTDYFAMGDYKQWTQGPEDWGSWQGPEEGPKDPSTRGLGTQVTTVFSLGLCCTYCNYKQLVSVF